MKTDRTALLETALSLFYERGYHAVTIYDIGAAVGVTGAALYRHFRSKGEVLGLLCEMTLDRLAECTGDARDTAQEELDALVAGQVRFVLSYPKLLTVTTLEGRALDPSWREEVKQRQRAHLKRWTTTLAALYPSEDKMSLDVAVYSAIGLINSAARWPAQFQTAPDFESRLIKGVHQVLGTLVLEHQSIGPKS